MTGSATDPGAVAARWGLRPVPAEARERYRSAGWWSDASLGSMVADGLTAMADVAFSVWSAERPWSGTMGQVDQAARRLAGALRADGVGAGSVVVVQLPNWAEAGVAFWAAAYLGAVVVPVVHFYGAKEVGHILRVTRPDVVISADRFGHVAHLDIHEQLLADLPDTRWLVVGATPAHRLPPRAQPLDRWLEGPPLDRPLVVDPDAPAVVGFTSGTTRDPKGVVHSHRTIGFESRQLSDGMPTGGPPAITGAPVGHFIGMLNAFLMPLLRVRPVNLVDVWDPGRVIALMRDEGLGMGGGATYFLTSLLDHPDFGPDLVAQMPYVGLGGAPVPEAVTRRVRDLGIVVYRSYGSTEHPSVTGCTVDDPEEKRLTTDGRARPGVEVRLGPDGEILSRGPDCFIGYTDPELTSSVFDDDGWYHTGDAAVIDDEGYLTVTDRLADFIIRGGENVSAQEIEELVATVPGVAEVCVVAEPDQRLGERAAAVVRVQPGARHPTLADLQRHLEAVGLARQKWPESLYVVEDLPRTASGKVQKFVVRSQLRAGRPPGPT